MRIGEEIGGWGDEEKREEQMKRDFLLIGLVAIFLISAGCANIPTRLEMDYGTSFKLSKFNQILNPEAEKNLEPVMGFDGDAALKTMEKYEKGFEKPTPPPAFTLSIGAMGKQ